MSRCMFGANLVILAHNCDKLLCRQAIFPRILIQNGQNHAASASTALVTRMGQNDLEGQGQWPPFSIPTESIPWCKFGANLVIPAQICDELSCGQSNVYGRTDGQTGRRRQRQYPFGLKGREVKTVLTTGGITWKRVFDHQGWIQQGF